MLVSTIEQVLAEVVDRHRVLYEDRTIDARLRAIIRAGAHTNVAEDEVLHILRRSRAVFFDTHV
jgi:orotate phosphoribosyltransferase